MRNSLRSFLPVIACLGAGCQSLAVQGSTLAHARTVPDLLEEQVVENVREFFANASAIPAHVRITAGSAQVNTSGTVTGGAAILPGADTYSLGLTGQRSWTSNWTVQPVTDGLTLERLQFLYRFALRVAENPTESLEDRLRTLTAACLDGQCQQADVDEFLIWLFGARDARGRSTYVDWSFDRDPNGNVKIDVRRQLQYTATPKTDEATAIRAKLAGIPVGWLSVADGNPQIARDTRSFRGFVLLTQEPDLSAAFLVSTGGGVGRILPGRSPRSGPMIFLQQPILDPAR